jgi:hypothetical protein
VSKDALPLTQQEQLFGQNGRQFFLFRPGGLTKSTIKTLN